MSRLKHSITLYGFGSKYSHLEWSFEDCMMHAKELGGDGIELVPVQMMPSYPSSDSKWNNHFKDLCEKYGLNPVCYSAYIDLGVRPDRDMDADEKYDSTIRDLEIACELGFKILRSQFALTPEVMEKCLPYAEKLGIHLAVELHGPHVPSTPIWQDFLRLFERVNSPYLGVVPDMSSFTYAPPKTLLNNDEPGKDRDAGQKLIEAFNRGVSREDLAALNRDLGGSDANNDLIEQLFYRYFRDKVDYDGLAALLKYSKYIHGKFWYIDENLECFGIDYPRIVKLIKNSGFDGFIASEFEGDGFDKSLDDMEQIRRHIKMLDNLWKN
jgi:sugar phosphate isomerase/epimerase